MVKVQELLGFYFFHAITMLQTQHRPINHGFLCITWAHLIETKEERGERYHRSGIHQQEGKEGKTIIKSLLGLLTSNTSLPYTPKQNHAGQRGFSITLLLCRGQVQFLYVFYHLDKTSCTSMLMVSQRSVFKLVFLGQKLPRSGSGMSNWWEFPISVQNCFWLVSFTF